MAKVVKCRDVGVDCDFEARGETEQEILARCAEHARSAHDMDATPPAVPIPPRLARSSNAFWPEAAV